MTDRQIEADVSENRGPAIPFDQDPGFDDGLVHDHRWACRERGAPAP